MEKLIINRKKVKTFIRPFLVMASSILLAVSTTGCYLYPTVEKVEVPELKKLEAKQYVYTEIKKQSIEKMYSFKANFVPVKYEDVFYKYSNMKVGDVLVYQGDYVNQGDKLVIADTTETEKKIKKADVEIKKANMELAQLKAKNASPFEIQMKEIDIQMKENQKEIYQRDIDRAVLYAPISGKVVYADHTLDKGKSFPVNKPIVRIADESELLLEYTMDMENDVDIAAQSVLKVGMKAQVIINSKVYEGEVVMTPAIASANKDPINVDALRIKVNNPDEQVKCGQLAEVNILLQRKDNVIVINKALINKFGLKKYVNIYKDDGTLEQRIIETGLDNGTEVEVVSGLNEGDKVVLNAK